MPPKATIGFSRRQMSVWLPLTIAKLTKSPLVRLTETDFSKPASPTAAWLPLTATQRSALSRSLWRKSSQRASSSAISESRTWSALPLALPAGERSPSAILSQHFSAELPIRSECLESAAPTSKWSARTQVSTSERMVPVRWPWKTWPSSEPFQKEWCWFLPTESQPRRQWSWQPIITMDPFSSEPRGPTFRSSLTMTSPSQSESVSNE